MRVGPGWRTVTETDDPPDLERLEPGHEVRVTYVSDRSGNEVDRTGVVASTGHTDAGRRLVRVHTEEKHPLKHVYVALLEVETDDGDEYVGAWSLTAQADRDGVDEPPKVGKTYRYRLTPERTSFLGLTDRVVRQGGPTPVLVTDGGRGPIKEPDADADTCAQCSGRLETTDHVPGNMGFRRVECADCGATGTEHIREASPGFTYEGPAFVA